MSWWGSRGRPFPLGSAHGTAPVMKTTLVPAVYAKEICMCMCTCVYRYIFNMIVFSLDTILSRPTWKGKII